ncbi:MAG: sugar phosphate nucleotidyltransferase [Bdellovibrionota bacterium]
MIRHAMLMAAGLGTRLRPFTELAPKPLLPVLGVPMAQFALDALAAAGVEQVVANVHHLHEQAKSGLGRLELGGATLTISDESRELLGSGGGIRKALPQFRGEAFYYYNSDVLCDLELRALANAHERLRARWGVTMTLALSLPRGSGRYREIRFDPDQGLVTGLGEVTTGKPYFASVAVMEEGALAHAPAGGAFEFVPHILEPNIRAGKVGAFVFGGAWHDIGSPELWLSTHLELIRGLELGSIAPRWRRRLESVNLRHAEGIWVSRRSPRVLRGEWAGPAYFDGAIAPKKLGPNGVLYGLPCPQDGVDGIGFGTEWFSLK